MNDFEEMIEQSREAALADNVEACVPNVPPYGAVAVSRVHDLTDAIAKYVDDPQLDRQKLAFMLTWARELLEQLDLLDTMLIYTR